MQQEVIIQKNQSEGWRTYVPIVLYSLGHSILREFGISTPLAVVIAGSVVYLPAYWFPLKTEVSFWKHFLSTEYIFIGFALTIWIIPAYLIGKIPVWLAYGLPVFVFLLLMYPLDRFVYGTFRKVSIVKWLAGSLSVSILVALLRSFLSSPV